MISEAAALIGAGMRNRHEGQTMLFGGSNSISGRKLLAATILATVGLNGLRTAVQTDRSHFWEDLSLPFYGYNPPAGKYPRASGSLSGCRNSSISSSPNAAFDAADKQGD
jgi:hypothetical protein